jgi:hypothetical protein
MFLNKIKNQGAQIHLKGKRPVIQNGEKLKVAQIKVKEDVVLLKIIIEVDLLKVI